MALSVNHMAAAASVTARDRLQWAPSYAAMEINDRHLSPEDGHRVGVFVIFMDTSLLLSEVQRE